MGWLLPHPHHQWWQVLLSGDLQPRAAEQRYSTTPSCASSSSWKLSRSSRRLRRHSTLALTRARHRHRQGQWAPHATTAINKQWRSRGNDFALAQLSSSTTTSSNALHARTTHSSSSASAASRAMWDATATLSLLIVMSMTTSTRDNSALPWTSTSCDDDALSSSSTSTSLSCWLCHRQRDAKTLSTSFSRRFCSALAIIVNNDERPSVSRPSQGAATSRDTPALNRCALAHCRLTLSRSLLSTSTRRDNDVLIVVNNEHSSRQFRSCHHLLPSSSTTTSGIAYRDQRDLDYGPRCLINSNKFTTREPWHVIVVNEETRSSQHFYGSRPLPAIIVSKDKWPLCSEHLRDGQQPFQILIHY